jgi:hypothetical protein
VVEFSSVTDRGVKTCLHPVGTQHSWHLQHRFFVTINKMLVSLKKKKKTVSMPYMLDDKLLLFVSVSTPLIYNHIINNYSSDNLEHNATK